MNVGGGWGHNYGGGYWHGHYPNYYHGWFNGGWNWAGPTWWGTTGAFATGWMLGNVADNFVNPYYVAPAVGTTVVYNYSEPVPVYVESPPVVVEVPTPAPVASPSLSPPPVTEAAPAPQPAAEDPKVKEAGAHFDAARAHFRAMTYDSALANVDRAIQVLPGDAALHEFRSLVLFAQKKYKDAAGVIYSVLAVGPGWSWDTVSALYADPKTYEAQLKDLEAYARANPRDSASRFLLAYHCLILDQRDVAVRLLNQVVELNPKDKLAEAMAKAISQSLQPTESAKPRVSGP